TIVPTEPFAAKITVLGAAISYGGQYDMPVTVKCEIAGEVHRAGPGGVVHIPPNVPHHTAAEPGEDLVYIYVKDTAWGLKGVPAGEQAGEQPPEDEKY
ncbi:MAG: AraC family ligand binding domain-containing protein, partial [Nitrospinota bacterium]|nr:AraC family ligand binding domain-containing protein [Nitrospinota bacterium]